MIIYEKTYLEHYGVKGMKWGVRRYEDERVRKARQRLLLAKAAPISTKKGNAIRIERKNLSDERLAASMRKKNLKDSETRKKIEAYYRKQGLTAQEARLEAYKRERTMKALAVVGGLTVAGVGIYAAKKFRIRNVDKILKPGTKLQNINTHNPQGIKDAFYATFEKSDKALYRGMYGGKLAKTGNAVYNTTIKTTDAVKIASPKSAQKILADLVKKDPKYAAELREYMQSAKALNPMNPKQQHVMKAAARDLEKGRVTKNVHDAVNIQIVNARTDPKMAKITKGYYNALKQKGYSAVKDVNDMSYSGYRAKAPTVFFDTAKTKVDSSSVMSTKDLVTKRNVEIGKNAVKHLSPYATAEVSAIAGTGAVGHHMQTRSDRNAVRQYREDHPNSKLSYNEILRTLNNRR